jgi:hypothetical protein
MNKSTKIQKNLKSFLGMPIWTRRNFSMKKTGEENVLYPEKGVCADPVDEGAILGKGGPSPHSSDKERQLAPDIGRGET